jgi:uncharacterized protein YlxW (UPF0749 family)
VTAAEELRALFARLRTALARVPIDPSELESLMAALEDMTTAVGALESAFAAVETEVATLKSADNETALEGLVGRVNVVASGLTALVTPATTTAAAAEPAAAEPAPTETPEAPAAAAPEPSAS